MSSTVTTALLNAIKSRKFTSISRMFAPGATFEAWTPSGHWTAEDGPTIARIIETWFSPGAGSVISWSHETSGAKGAATLEYEITWKMPPEDQERCLRQVFILTIKGDRIASARVYCPGLHTDFPDVDIEKQRRAKGLTAAPAMRSGQAAAKQPVAKAG